MMRRTPFGTHDPNLLWAVYDATAGDLIREVVAEEVPPQLTMAQLTCCPPWFFGGVGPDGTLYVCRWVPAPPDEATS